MGKRKKDRAQKKGKVKGEPEVFIPELMEEKSHEKNGHYIYVHHEETRKVGTPNENSGYSIRPIPGFER